jgi:hypothetical protein
MEILKYNFVRIVEVDAYRGRGNPIKQKLLKV